MPILFFDFTFILIIPAMILAFWAQASVHRNMARFSKVAVRKGQTGAQVAQALLEKAGIYDVPVEMINANGGDHYDPRCRTIRLSAHNFQSSSVTAVAVAAHEAGHAIQHSESYVPLAFRSGIFPVVRFTSFLAVPLIFLGFLLATMGEFSAIFIDIGIIFFTFTVVFHLITLPVEFNASRRAMELLEVGRYLDDDELGGAKKVLRAAAMTYVAAAAVSVMQLLRLLLISGRRR